MSIDETTIKNKSVLITGGTGSIGQALVLILAQYGFNVIFTYYNNLDKAREIADKYENIKFTKLDLSDINSINEVAEFIKTENNNQLDFLVNNAAIVSDSLFEKMSEEQIRNVIDVDLIGPMILTNKLLGFIKESKGRIINISSVSGQIGNIGQANYAAAKLGLVGFTKTLAKEMGKYGVTVNAVSPALIDSQMLDKVPLEIKDKFINQSSLKRMGKPIDIAELILFMLSNSGNYITGQVININGGLYYGQ